MTDSGTPQIAAFIGIDWADEKHRWALQVAGPPGPRTPVEQGEVAHTPEALEAWICALGARYPGRSLAIALEQSRGALLFALSKYAHVVLYPIHPNTLDHYRKSFYPSGAKSDPGDAALILELLVKHPERLRRFQPDTVETRTLQFLVEARREAVDEKTRCLNRLTSQLKAQLQADLAAALPATHDAAVIEAGVLTAQRVARQLQLLRDSIAQLDRRLAELTQAHPDRAIFQSLPGAGPVMVPRLIAAFGTQRERYATAAQMQCYAGIAPVTERSGKHNWVHWRWACPKFLRQTFHEWAWLSTRTSAWARAFYQRQREKGKSHHAAVRALAFKWLRVVFRCWKDAKPYDQTRYSQALQKRAKPVEIPVKKTSGLTSIKDLLA